MPFDKGIAFCLMPRNSYEEKLEPILNLCQFEKFVNSRKNAKNPIVKEEERIVEALKKFKK